MLLLKLKTAHFAVLPGELIWPEVNIDGRQREEQGGTMQGRSDPMW